MISVTNNYLWLKCYLNLFKIVPRGMGSLKSLARAIAKIYSVSEKNLKKFHCFLLTVIFISLSSTVIAQMILSLSDKSNAFTISTGIVVRNDLEWDVCKFAVDSNSNSSIPPYMCFFVNIFVNLLYIICPHNAIM